MKKHSDSPRGPSQRQLRVGELIRHALAQMIMRGDLIDDAFKGQIITVPEVRMSPDLKIATAYLSLHDETHEKAVLKAFARLHGYIRREVAHQVNLKYAPEIRFRMDETLDAAAKIDALLQRPEVKRDLANPFRHIDEVDADDKDD
jgi:ribosome-binding factor A